MYVAASCFHLSIWYLITNKAIYTLYLGFFGNNSRKLWKCTLCIYLRLWFCSRFQPIQAHFSRFQLICRIDKKALNLICWICWNHEQNPHGIGFEWTWPNLRERFKKKPMEYFRVSQKYLIKWTLSKALLFEVQSLYIFLGSLWLKKKD